jgi:GLPGLI family protein
MKARLFIQTSLITLIILLPFFTMATTNKPSDNSQLDKTLFRVIYKSTLQATKEKQPVVIIDTMALDISQDQSIYYDWLQSRRDSIASKIKSESTMFIVEPTPEFIQSILANSDNYKITDEESKGETAVIFKTRSSSKVVTTNRKGETFLKLSETVVPQWTMCDDEIQLLGYTAKKATTTFRGRNYTAYFTLDIPINDGPWKLFGLPGLILEAGTDDEILKFEAIGLEQVEGAEITPPVNRKYEDCQNFTDYYNLLEKLNRNINIGYYNKQTFVYIPHKNPYKYPQLELGE